MSNFKSTGNAKSKASKYVDRNLTDIISEIDSSLNEAEKEKKKTIVFNLAKMEYVVHNDPDLSEFYNKMVEENKDLYGYHYNEAIMNIIFNVKVLKNDKYLRMYKNAPVKKKKRRDKYGAEDLKTPSTKRREKLEKEREKRKEKKKMQNETTSASGSGAYASPYAWAGGSKPMRREPIWKGGVVIQEGDETLLEHHLNTKEEKIEFIINNVGDKYGSEEELFDLTDNALDVVYLNVEKEMGIDDISPEDLEDIDIEEVEVDDLDESSKDKQRYKNMLKDLQGDDYDLDDIDDELLDTLSTKKEKFKKKEINNESFADLNEEDDKREMIVATDKNIKEVVIQQIEELGDDADLNHIDVSQVTNMYKLFKHSNFNGNISQWDVSNVEIMIETFAFSKFNGDISNWNVKKVEFMGGMFFKSNFNQDISKWNVSNVRYMYGMFGGTTFNHNISNWDVSSVENARDIFYECSIKDEFKPNFNEHTLIEEVNEDERLDESSKDKQRYKNLLKGLQGNDYELDDIEDKLDKYNNKNKKKSKKNEKELVDEASIIEPSDNTISMSRDEDDSMKMTKPLTTSTVSGIDEDEELLKSHKEFISEIAVKRHPSMIRVDRVKNQNKNNFKQGIDRINDIQTAQEEITTVDEPQKYSDDIEKEVLKRTKGQSFKNVGNSANEKGDEIPKGNITKDEEEELDTIRDGMHTLKYTREPDSRFEERMKRDMGDDMYDKRKRSLEAKKNMPMYIKDKQPISEDYSMLGVYNDKFGKDNFITIKPGNISLVNEEYVNENNYIRIKTEGLGNRVNNRFRLNESVDKLIESVDFYINESNGYIVGIEKSNSKGMINESVENTSKSIINESHLNKMRSLIDYRPSKYIDTVKSKSMID